MKKILLGCLVMTSIIALTGCTEQNRAKNFGGSMTMELEPNRKLEMVTWKDSDLWILTKPMTEDDVAETYIFHEDSSYGIMEGSITIKEIKE